MGQTCCPVGGFFFLSCILLGPPTNNSLVFLLAHLQFITMVLMVYCSISTLQYKIKKTAVLTAPVMGMV